MEKQNLSQNWSLNEQDLCLQAVKPADLECCFILFHVFAFSKCTAFSIPRAHILDCHDINKKTLLNPGLEHVSPTQPCSILCPFLSSQE